MKNRILKLHLQLDMLAFYDESGDRPVLVVGGGVPESWTDKDISIDSYKTKYGFVSWSYKKNVMKVLLKGFRIKPEVRLGTSFGKNTELIVEFK